MNEKLTIGSCFSGIGGLDLGLEWTGGFETKWQIEIDPYARRVLAKHWPNVQRFSDITELGRLYVPGNVDVICGGYPCQPFSLAGQRAGENDPRHLWPHMRRAILILRPQWVLLENVPGHLSMGFGRVLGDLAECGYDAEWGLLSAAGVGAPHLRRRLFVIAHATKRGWRQGNTHAGGTPKGTGAQGQWCGPSNGDWWKTEPGVRRVAHGIPSRVDRLRCLGNAVVPQVAQRVGEMILDYEAKTIRPCEQSPQSRQAPPRP